MPHPASAGFYYGLAGGAAYNPYYQASSSGTVTSAYQGKPSYMAGLLLGKDLGSVVFESGAYYLMRKIQFSSSVGGVTTSTADLDSKYLHFPLLIRFNPMQTVSFGMGGFYDLARDAGGTSNQGPMVDMRLQSHALGRIGVFLDLSFLKGLAKDSRAQTSTEFFGMFGFEFGP